MEIEKKHIIIDTPPPTISGKLHIGHIFSYLHIDFIARYFEFLGYELNYPIGFDCNGLPTEKLFLKEKERNPNLDIFDIIEKYKNDYLNTFKNINLHCNFLEYYLTVDDDFKEDAYKAFHKLKEKNLIYEKEKEIFWDQKFNCALSNSEIFEKDGVIYSDYSKTPADKRMSFEIFVKTKDYKKELLEQANKINFYPESMKIKLIQWIENLNEDWCISRNRKFGVQIPNSDKMFDTWFISSLTPQYSGNSKASIRFHSHDIIRSWTFYSLVMSYHLYQNIPFDNVVISGWILDGNGKKYSKSEEEENKKNQKPIDVDKIIKEIGPNNLRFWAAKIGIGNDTIFPIEDYYQKRGTLREFNLLKRKFDNFEKCIEIHEKDGSNNETDHDNLILNFNNYYEKFSYNFHNFMKSFDIAKAFQEFIDIIEKYREIILGNHPNDGIKMKENKTQKNIQFSKEILIELKNIYKIFFD